MFKKLLFVLPLVALLGSVANADTIGGASCASCFGSTYTLTYGTTANPNVFDIYLTVDATGFTKASTDKLNSVSLKLTSQSSNITSVNLVSPIPTGFGTTIAGGLNADGCAGNGNGSFCSQSTGLGLDVAGAGDIYTFNWKLTVVDPSKIYFNLDEASVKVLYVVGTGKNSGKPDATTAENITLNDIAAATTSSPVPEPSSLVLFGTGALSVAAALRRKLIA